MLCANFKGKDYGRQISGKCVDKGFIGLFLIISVALTYDVVKDQMYIDAGYQQVKVISWYTYNWKNKWRLTL